MLDFAWMQFFYRYLNGPEADNLPACPACIYGEIETWNQRDSVLDDPDAFLDDENPVIGTEKVRPLSTCPFQSTRIVWNSHDR